MKFEDKTFMLGVGAQKAGTTWLHDYLAGRGDIYLPRNKEMHYFNTKYGPERCRRRKPHRLIEADAGRDPALLRTDNAYKNHFRRHVPDEIAIYGEITPAYALIGVEGFREVRGLFPNIRLVFIMRDPVDRFRSQVQMFSRKRAKANKSPPDLASVLDNPQFLLRSRYDDTIRALEAEFRREEIIYLFYETLFRAESIGLLCDRLGLPYLPANFEKEVNAAPATEPLPQEMQDRLAAAFAPTYRFCRDRFGGEVPAQWRSCEDGTGEKEIGDNGNGASPAGKTLPAVVDFPERPRIHAAGARAGQDHAPPEPDIARERPSADALPRVFVIGFNKCGTRTIHHYFAANGYRAVHWDKGNLAKTIFRNLADSRPLLEGYERFSVFSDMESISPDFALEAYKLYPYLGTAYPDSLFILNTRDVDKWIASRLGHGNGRYAKKWKRALDLNSDEKLLLRWRSDWERHHQATEEYFARTGLRFLKFDIETDPPEKINAALPEYRLDPAKYEQRGQTRERPRRAAAARGSS